MRGLAAALGIVAITGSVYAQPQAQPPPQAQPQPAPWYRLTLDDGRVVDVQIVGNDAANFHVLMNGATYSLPRTKIVGSVALQPAAPTPSPVPPPTAYAPQPYAAPPPPPAAPVAEDNDVFSKRRRAAGFAYLGAAYFITAPIALARMDNDSNAKLGLIPVVGPLAWPLADDEDDAFEDGWDWLGAFDAAIQGLGLYLIITGDSGSTKQQTVRLVPMSGRGQHGFAIGGSF
jgi:hypothetical protein